MSSNPRSGGHALRRIRTISRGLRCTRSRLVFTRCTEETADRRPSRPEVGASSGVGGSPQAVGRGGGQHAHVRSAVL